LLPKALLFSLLVLIGNPLILMSIMGLLGYKKRTSLQTGFTVAQISEFSLILMTLGVTYGHVTKEALSLVTLVGIITIFGSTYFILYSDKIYAWLDPYLNIFERKHAKEKQINKKRYSVILFGGNRIGHDFIESFKKIHRSFLVIDHNPELVDRLRKEDVDVEYGDATNIDFLESLDMSQTKLVVSTIPDAKANTLINQTIKEIHPRATVIVVAHKVEDALEHYKNGVDYVVLPHFLGGHYASQLVVKIHNDPNQRNKIRKSHIKALSRRKESGQEHPTN
jgi:hypothetical protein